MAISEPHKRNPDPETSSLDVFLLGTVDLNSTIELQDRLRRELVDRTDCHGSIIICEHPPSITIGREGSFADIVVERDELIARRMEIRWTNRGGGTIVHLPGQICAYTVLPVERLNLAFLDFRERLIQSLVATGKELEIDCYPSLTPPGVVGRNGQFGFVGAAIQQGLSTGGVQLNVSLPQEPFEMINWGTGAGKITSISAQRSRAIAISTVRESLVRNLAATFRYENYHLFTGHPLLHRSTQKVYMFA